MRRRLLIVLPVFIAVGLMAAFWGLSVALAQTPTPTPSPTVTFTPTATPTLLPYFPTNTPTPTPTNTPTPTPTGTPALGGTPTAIPSPYPTPPYTGTYNPYVWWCLLYNQGYGAESEICTWGDYFEWEFGSTAADGIAVTNRWDLIVVPPADTTSVALACSYICQIDVCDPASGTCNDSNCVFTGSEQGSALTSVMEGGGSGNFNHFDQGDDMTVMYTHVFTVSKGNNSYETWSQFGFGAGTNNPHTGRPYIAGIAAARGRDPDNQPSTSSVSVRYACEARRLVMEDGSTVIPPGATPVGDFPTPTPTGWYTWTDGVWNEVPYFEAPPQQSDFYFGPGTTTCAPTLPGWAYTWEDMPLFGTTSFGWSPQQICLQSYPIYSELLNIRIDTLVGQFVSVLFALFLFNVWRRQS